MALMPMGSKIPQSSSVPVRYSHVAHFVGLSLLRDPNLARNKAVSRSVSSGELRQQISPDCFGDGEQTLSSSSSLPSLSVERIDKLRCQINWLKAEQRAEKEQVKKLEHSLTESLRSEGIARDRAKMHRQRCDEHKKQLKNVRDRAKEVKEEQSRADRLAKTWSQQASPASASSKADKSGEKMRATAPTGDTELELSREAVESMSGVKVYARSQVKDYRPSEISVSSEMFENEEALARFRRESIRKELMSRVEKRADTSGEVLGGRLEGRPLTYFQLKRGLIDEKLSEKEIQALWDNLTIVEAPNALDAFKLINLSGSGRICSNEFADGVARVGVPWQKLTGLRRPKDLFRLFDTDHDGVLTLFELFPAQRDVKKDETGRTTPEFWRMWERGNGADVFALDEPKGRAPHWNNGVADDSLAALYEREGKDADAKFMRKWMRNTMRRLKGRGKSDARVREMCAMHLPKGTGPKDRQEVSTFSDAEVKQCKREYQDAVLDPQRTVQKALYDLRETRRDLSNYRHKLWTVAMEPILRQQALEEKNNVAKCAFGGLNLGIHHEDLGDSPEEGNKKPKSPEVSGDFAKSLGAMTPF